MDWLLLVAAIATAMIVFTFIMRILRAVISAAVAVAIVAVVLQLVFGIGPTDLWYEMTKLWRGISQGFGL
jgi:hypothetical protein